MLASLAMIIAGLGFLGGGAGMLLDQNWGSLTIKYVAILSTVALALFWDGGLQKIADKGLVGIIINLVIYAVTLVF